MRLHCYKTLTPVNCVVRIPMMS